MPFLVNMIKNSPVLIKTEDQSHTLFLPEIDEYYHSRFGAIEEALHIFIRSGYEKTDNNPLHIFEVGFGTGLNALLTFMRATRDNRKVFYSAIELYPLGPAVYTRLNYPQILHADPDVFLSMHELSWEKEHQLTENFLIRKIHADFLSYHFTRRYNLVYFDAFGPDKQPAMWAKSRLEAVFAALFPGGIFITYSAKGSLRRALEKTGFRVNRLPGPPGKREIIQAIKPL